MSKFLQLAAYTVSLLIVLFIGFLASEAFWQGTFHARHLLGGKPLPVLFQFLAMHHTILIYLFLFPWLGFVELPFFSLTEIRFWDASLFILRFIVFLLIESFLLAFLTFTLFLPFIPYYSVMEDYRGSRVDVLVQCIFCSCVLLVPIMFGTRVVMRKMTRRQRPTNPSE
jgi:hypothetical protein